MVESFYRNLFTKSNVNQECVRKVLETVGAKISAKEQQLCEGDIQMEEIIKAIKESLVSSIKLLQISWHQFCLKCIEIWKTRKRCPSLW